MGKYWFEEMKDRATVEEGKRDKRQLIGDRMRYEAAARRLESDNY